MRTLYAGMVILLAVTFCFASTKAQVPFVGGFLDDLQTRLHSEEATAQSNLNIASGNEYQLLSAALKTLIAEFANQRDKTFDQLNDFQVKALTSLRDEITEFQRGVYKDTSIIQAKMLRVTAQIEFWKQLPFIVTG